MEELDSIKSLQVLEALLGAEKEFERETQATKLLESSIKTRRKSGITWYPLQIKEKGHGIGDQPFLVVGRPREHWTEEHNFTGGKTVNLFSENQGADLESQKTTGIVHYANEREMKIILHGDSLPDFLDLDRIGVDLLFDEATYREMEKALSIVKKAKPGGRLYMLREILLGDRPAAFAERSPLSGISSNLNETQVRAIEHIVSAQDIALVHGPPGTGKTTTLVEAVAHLVITEKQVLVCAPSNAAADLLTERLGKRGLNVVRVGNLSRIDEDIIEHTLDGILAVHPDTTQIKRLKKEADEYRRLAGQYKRHFGPAEQHQRKSLINEAKKRGFEASTIESYLVDDILDKAEVITCTLVGAANRNLEGRHYKTAIIDEAAQALDPALWIAAIRADRLILAGDPFQLPPTVKSPEAINGKLNVTLLERSIHKQGWASLLGIQYRMHKDIMEFSNNQFYKGALQADPSVATHTLPYDYGKVVTFIDTSGCSYDEEQNPETFSLRNIGEVQLIIRYLNREVVPLLGVQLPGEDIPSVGIISPYREQVKYLQEVMPLEVMWPGKVPVSIQTVDAFQGQERDLIVISLVRSNDRREIGFLSDIRRMNVAMTRARKKLIVVGDSATIGAHPFYKAFLEYIDVKGAYISAWSYLE